MVSGVGGPGGGGKISGAGPAAPGAAAATSAERLTGKSFGEAVDRAEGAAKIEQPSPLERLRAGEIDLAGYVEARVREATSHLEGVLPPAEIERVRDELRDVVAHDPDVAAFARSAEVGR